ncbi:cupin domain-containing protein [Azohydromonas caseinilytica]|uniref:Cupin domain-containing protein n=1 Tax=Azohydromonas caseinilytica TaxID=2728836 RepID=A0A848F623_9BURK|nr:cupin domain-containing protein [Azohydromonas caseinilytica]NML15034.1 cupin domain-containing protein [Azohydromonas caseinilytica]
MSGGPIGNLFASLPQHPASEVFDTLLDHDSVRIERIVSQGHTAPAEGWFDQDEHEWVLVLEGAGRLLFEDGREVELRRGDHLHIPAHVRHKVSWTDPQRLTVWLAVFYA